MQSLYLLFFLFIFPSLIRANDVKVDEIAGSIFLDVNHDGCYDIQDEHIERKTISLYTYPNILISEIESDSTGHFLFHSLDKALDAYYLEIILDYSQAMPLESNCFEGSIQEQGNQRFTIDLDNIVEPSNIFIGVKPLMEIVSTIFVDDEGNGIYDSTDQDIGSAGISSIVMLYSADSLLVKEKSTDYKGQVKFDGLMPGQYYIQFHPPSIFPVSSSITVVEDNGVDHDDNGIQNDTDNDGITDGIISSPLVTLFPGSEPVNEPIIEDWTPDNYSDRTQDFGLLPCISVSGSGYIDSDGDGCPSVGDSFERYIERAYLYACDTVTGIPDAIGEGDLMDSDWGLEYFSQQNCLTPNRLVYLEYEIDEDLSYASFQNCGLNIENIQGNIGQIGCVLSDELRDSIYLGLADFTSTVESFLASAIKMSPQPANSNLHIAFPKEMNVKTIMIRNDLGVVIDELTNLENSSELDYDSRLLYSGTYYLEFRLKSGKSLTKQIIKI